MDLCAQRLQTGLYQPSLQFRAMKSEFTRLSVPLSHLPGVISPNRKTCNDAVDQQIPIKPLQKKIDWNAPDWWAPRSKSTARPQP